MRRPTAAFMVAWPPFPKEDRRHAAPFGEFFSTFRRRDVASRRLWRIFSDTDTNTEYTGQQDDEARAYLQA